MRTLESGRQMVQRARQQGRPLRISQLDQFTTEHAAYLVRYAGRLNVTITGYWPYWLQRALQRYPG